MRRCFRSEAWRVSLASGFKAKGDLTFHQPLDPATRLVVGVCAALTFWAPYDLLIRPGVAVFTLGMIPFWIIALGALGVGVPILASCIIGFNRTLVISPRNRTVTVVGAGNFGLRFEIIHKFQNLGVVFAELQRDRDGPPLWEVAFRRPAPKPPLLISRTAQEADARALVAQITAAMGR